MRRECVDHVVVLDEGTFSLNGEAPRGSGRRKAARSFRAGLIIPMINSWQLGVATAKRRTADFDSDAEVRIPSHAVRSPGARMEDAGGHLAADPPRPVVANTSFGTVRSPSADNETGVIAERRRWRGVILSPVGLVRLPRSLAQARIGPGPIF
jgi:hypothetical protein